MEELLNLREKLLDSHLGSKVQDINLKITIEPLAGVMGEGKDRAVGISMYGTKKSGFPYEMYVCCSMEKADRLLDYAFVKFTKEWR